MLAFLALNAVFLLARYTSTTSAATPPRLAQGQAPAGQGPAGQVAGRLRR
jgi:hypothetical protein